mmetsp:Transcript_16198/g.34033  ORF Transcript_16198/g.34033 Transcript_16198/m.34033 type:complete len:286 (+) Transcript_16198:1614-2471(+)
MPAITTPTPTISATTLPTTTTTTTTTTAAAAPPADAIPETKEPSVLPPGRTTPFRTTPRPDGIPSPAGRRPDKPPPPEGCTPRPPARDEDLVPPTPTSPLTPRRAGTTTDCEEEREDIPCRPGRRGTASRRGTGPIARVPPSSLRRIPTGWEAPPGDSAADSDSDTATAAPKSRRDPTPPPSPLPTAGTTPLLSTRRRKGPTATTAAGWRARRRGEPWPVSCRLRSMRRRTPGRGSIPPFWGGRRSGRGTRGTRTLSRVGMPRGTRWGIRLFKGWIPEGTAAAVR